MLSKTRIKYFRSLGLKKNRDAQEVFIAEGPKLVKELLPFFTAQVILGEQSYASQFSDVPFEAVAIGDIQAVSLQKQPQGVFAVFNRRATDISQVLPQEQLVLALDGVQDPGNMGTILRICDWFGIAHIVCSPDCVDVYNPKVVQSTMGALGRVSVHYTDLKKFIADCNCTVYGTFLEGEPIQLASLSPAGILVMGNEGKGISPSVEALISHKLFIPPYLGGWGNTESLNVASATAIACYEFRRQ